MEVNLSKSSFTSKLVKYSFNELDDNFCPYFWKAVLAYITLPIIGFRYLFSSLFFTRSFDDTCYVDDDKYGAKIGSTLFLIFLLFVLVCSGMYFSSGILNIANSWIGAIVGTLSLAVIIVITVIIIHIIASSISELQMYILTKKLKRKIKREESLAEQYVKAKKLNICPKINWKD